ncbi:MAG TPA: hypothetical protein VFW16_01565 [Streptosporangiaceae bacterium]|nr:hypothetical protein [Streptosporangiaceae bacterium]
MSTGATVAIIVVIVIILIVAAVAATASRRRRLRERFGPEYDRLVADQQSQRKAEAELASRERRVRSLDIRPLTAAARTEYAAQWTSIQERFVDHPASAVSQAQQLVTAVLQDRGYPTEGYEQMLADLSVEHARTLEHYRAAHAISESTAGGSASTEDMRQAMIHYREMFDELLGDSDVREPAAAHEGPAGTPNGAVPPSASQTEADTAAAPDAAARQRAGDTRP